MAEFRINVVVDPSGTRPGTDRVRRELGGLERTADRVRRTLTNALALVGVGTSVQQLIQLGDAYTNLENRIRVVTDSQEQLTRVTNELFQISNRTRASVEATATTYSSVALAARDLGVSQERLLQFTESLNQAVALSGASAQSASAALFQLSQGLGAGALRGEELNSVLEQTPVIADVIAESLGVTRGELRELGSEGRITAGIVLNAFADAREELAERFAQTVPTISQSFVVLRNNILQLIGTLASSSGAADGLSRAILSLANNVDTLARGVLAASIVIGTIFARRAIGAAVTGVTALTAAIAANPLGATAVAALAASAAVASFSDRISVSTDGLSTLADVAGVVFDRIRNGIGNVFEVLGNLASRLIAPFQSAEQPIQFSLESIVIFGALIADRFVGFFVGAGRAIVAAFQAIPRALELLFVSAFNAVSQRFETFINNIIFGLNQIPGVALDQFATIELTATTTASELGGSVGDAFTSGFRSVTGAQDLLGGILDEAEARAIARDAVQSLFAEDDTAFGTGDGLGDLPIAGSGTAEELGIVIERLQELTNQQRLLSGALDQGRVGLDEYRLAQSALRLEAAELVFGLTDVEQRIRDADLAILDLAVSTGNATFADSFLLQLGRMTEGLNNFQTQAGTVFGSFFENFTSGFSNAIGQAIAGTASLGDALRNVATQALSQLIAGFVQLGIRFVINATIGRALAAAATATASAQAGALAAAWAPAAALASLATAGTNAAGASAAIASTVALSSGLAAATPTAAFADGGIVRGPGGPRDDLINAQLSDGEFVVNAAATARNRALLERINSGSVAAGTPMSASGPSVGAPVVNILPVSEVPGVTQRVEQVGPDQIRIIAEEVVQEQAGDAVARDIDNPNSAVSGALARNTDVQRRF